MTGSRRAYFHGYPHGLMFHRFHPAGGRPSGQGSLTGDEFEAILLHVGPERILQPAEWMEKLANGALGGNDLCLTFDDGLRSQYDVALPVMERYGLMGFWFVFSSIFYGEIDRNEIYACFALKAFASFDRFVDAFLSRANVPPDTFEQVGYIRFRDTLATGHGFYSENDIRFRYVRNFLLRKEVFEEIVEAMIADNGDSVAGIARDQWLTDEHVRGLSRQGHEIGLHTYDHPRVLALLPGEEQAAQYERNQCDIAAITGRPTRSMSHPLNSYSGETLEILASLGIECGFRSNMKRVGSDVRALELPREDSSNLCRAIRETASA